MSDLLTNIDIMYFANKLNIPLHGVYQKDIFVQLQPVYGGYVINLQSSYAGNGTHWVCLAIRDDYAIYFDSFGLSIPQVIIEFILKSKTKLKIIYSSDQIQHIKSIRCGYFCIYFLYFMLVLYPTKPVKYLINKHNAIFTLNDKKLNDKIIQQLIKSLFSNL